jgi:hypothetical protein
LARAGDLGLSGADLPLARAGRHHVRLLPRGVPLRRRALGGGAGGIELLRGNGSLAEQLLKAVQIGLSAVPRGLSISDAGARRGQLLRPGPVPQLGQLCLRGAQLGRGGGHLVARLRLLQRVGRAGLGQARGGARHACCCLIDLRLRLRPLQRQAHLSLRRAGAHHRQRRPRRCHLLPELRVVEPRQHRARAHAVALVDTHLRQPPRQLRGDVHLGGIHHARHRDPVRRRPRPLQVADEQPDQQHRDQQPHYPWPSSRLLLIHLHAPANGMEKAKS